MSHLGMSVTQHDPGKWNMPEWNLWIWLDLLSIIESESLSFMLPKDHLITYKYQQDSLHLTGDDALLLSQDHDCRLQVYAIKTHLQFYLNLQVQISVIWIASKSDLLWLFLRPRVINSLSKLLPLNSEFEKKQHKRRSVLVEEVGRILKVCNDTFLKISLYLQLLVIFFGNCLLPQQCWIYHSWSWIFSFGPPEVD